MNFITQGKRDVNIPVIGQSDLTGGTSDNDIFVEINTSIQQNIRAVI